MLTTAQRESFHRDGFVVVPSVLAPAQVRELRDFWIREFDHGERRPGDSEQSRADIFCRFPEIRWVLAHESIVAALRSLLGHDFVYIHEMAAHDSLFAGWHKDTTSQERQGHRFHWDDDYLMTQCALYLQDNGEYGGGIDVNPGSHREPDRYLAPRRRPIRKMLRKLGLRSRRAPNQVTVPSRGGDFVIFHTRTNHQATQPARRSVPPQHRKLAMFMLASVNNDHVDRYHEWLLSRPDMAHLRGHEVHPDLVRLGREHDLRVGQRDPGAVEGKRRSDEEKEARTPAAGCAVTARSEP